MYYFFTSIFYRGLYMKILYFWCPTKAFLATEFGIMDDQLRMAYLVFKMVPQCFFLLDQYFKRAPCSCSFEVALSPLPTFGERLFILVLFTQGKDSASEWRRPFIPSNAPAANVQTTPPHPPTFTLVVDADVNESATSVHYLPSQFIEPLLNCCT